MFKNITQWFKVLAVILFALALKMFLDHRKADYVGLYNKSGSYEQVSAVKHDMFKDLFVGLFVLLACGFAFDGKMFEFDWKDLCKSWAGEKLISMGGYFVFHQLVQPYMLTKLPNF